jgi:hypothetical protein
MFDGCRELLAFIIRSGTSRSVMHKSICIWIREWVYHDNCVFYEIVDHNFFFFISSRSNRILMNRIEKLYFSAQAFTSVSIFYLIENYSGRAYNVHVTIMREWNTTNTWLRTLSVNYRWSTFHTVRTIMTRTDKR